MNHGFKMIIIIIIKWEKNHKGAERALGGESVGERDLFYLFSFFSSL